MTRNSDPQAEPAAADRGVRELTEEEAERAAAQFRAAWQTQPPDAADDSSSADSQGHEVPNVEASAIVAAHPIVAIASEEAAPATGAQRPSSPLGRTMVGVPPPPSEARATAGESAAPRPPASAFNRTVVGIPVPAAGPGLAAEPPPPAERQRADAVQHAAPPLGGASPRPASFPPSAAEAHYVPEPQPGRISGRPNVISAWNLPVPSEGRRRTPSPALIVLVVASVALLILVATRFLGSDAEPTTESQPSRTEAVLDEDDDEDEARDGRRTPNARVQAAKPGSSGE